MWVVLNHVLLTTQNACLGPAIEVCIFTQNIKHCFNFSNFTSKGNLVFKQYSFSQYYFRLSILKHKTNTSKGNSFYNNSSTLYSAENSLTFLIKTCLQSSQIRNHYWQGSGFVATTITLLPSSLLLNLSLSFINCRYHCSWTFVRLHKHNWVWHIYEIHVLLSWFITSLNHDLTLKDVTCYFDQSIYIENIYWSS